MLARKKMFCRGSNSRLLVTVNYGLINVCAKPYDLMYDELSASVCAKINRLWCYIVKLSVWNGDALMAIFVFICSVAFAPSLCSRHTLSTAISHTVRWLLQCQIWGRGCWVWTNPLVQTPSCTQSVCMRGFAYYTKLVKYSFTFCQRRSLTEDRQLLGDFFLVFCPGTSLRDSRDPVTTPPRSKILDLPSTCLETLKCHCRCQGNARELAKSGKSSKFQGESCQEKWLKLLTSHLGHHQCLVHLLAARCHLF